MSKPQTAALQRDIAAILLPGESVTRALQRLGKQDKRPAGVRACVCVCGPSLQGCPSSDWQIGLCSFRLSCFVLPITLLGPGLCCQKKHRAACHARLCWHSHAVATECSWLKWHRADTSGVNAD